jgi:hypothetical protein
MEEKMKKATLATGLLFCVLLGSATAQNVGDSSVYFVTHYSNANTAKAPDATLRLINDGSQIIAACPNIGCSATKWAAIYVFDDSEEMISCCACQISADGLLSESVNQQLVNPAGPQGPGVLGSTFSTRGEYSRGVIEIISSNNGDPTNPVPVPGLRGWMTHIQASSVSSLGTRNPVEAAPFYSTESPIADSNLTALDPPDLGAVCGYALNDSSGWGWCGCSPEDQDF